MLMNIESPEQAQTCPYIAWLCCLYVIFYQTRKDGWLAIEEDLDSPSAENSIFSQFPLTLKQPYLDLVIDLLDQQINGHDLEWCDLYSEQAKAGLLHEQQKNTGVLSKLYRSLTANNIDENLVNLIVLFFQQGIRGHNPRSLCDLASMQIPQNKRPSRHELAEILSDLHVHPAEQASDINLDENAELFIRSLSEPNSDA